MLMVSDATSANSWGGMLLHSAMFNGQVEAAAAILEAAGPQAYDALTSKDRRLGCTALHEAVAAGHCQGIRLLLEGAAAQRGDQGVLDLLSASDRFGELPLHWAARLGHARAIGEIFRWVSGIPAEDMATTKSKDGSVPLHLAMRHGHVTAISTLLDRADNGQAAAPQLLAKNRIGEFAVETGVRWRKEICVRLVRAHPAYAAVQKELDRRRQEEDERRANREIARLPKDGHWKRKEEATQTLPTAPLLPKEDSLLGFQDLAMDLRTPLDLLEQDISREGPPLEEVGCSGGRNGDFGAGVARRGTEDEDMQSHSSRRSVVSSRRLLTMWESIGEDHVEKANERIERGGTAHRESLRRRVFSAMDTNGDGVVDRSEFRQEVVRRRLYNAMDTNMDGVVDRSEFLQEAVRRPLFNAMDTNGDGVVDRSEFRQAHRSEQPTMVSLLDSLGPIEVGFLQGEDQQFDGLGLRSSASRAEALMDGSRHALCRNRARRC